MVTDALAVALGAQSAQVLIRVRCVEIMPVLNQAVYARAMTATIWTQSLALAKHVESNVNSVIVAQINATYAVLTQTQSMDPAVVKMVSFWIA